MSIVVIAGLLMMGIIGLPFGLIIMLGRETWWGKLLAIVIWCSAWFGVGAAVGAEKLNDCKEFNDGVCTQCGGEYRLNGATRWRSNSEFYYTCQDCGWTIETHSLINKNS